MTKDNLAKNDLGHLIAWLSATVVEQTIRSSLQYILEKNSLLTIFR